MDPQESVRGEKPGRERLVDCEEICVGSGSVDEKPNGGWRGSVLFVGGDRRGGFGWWGKIFVGRDLLGAGGCGGGGGCAGGEAVLFGDWFALIVGEVGMEKPLAKALRRKGRRKN